MSRWQRWRFCSIDTMESSRQGQAGFTLVEVLMASAVVSLIMVSVFSLMLAANRVQDTAVTEGGLIVRGQRLLGHIVDGREGLIAAREAAVYQSQNGYESALSYIINNGGIQKISYQWDGDTVYRTVSTGNSLVQPPGGLGTPVAKGITHFEVDDSQYPSIRLELGSEGTVFQTTVTLRN